MKKLFTLTGIVAAIFMLALTVSISTASAQIVPSWDVTGTYVWNVLGTYQHDIVIDVQNPDGTFTGHGGYPTGGVPYTGAGQTTETISGQVVGSTFTMTTTYNGPYNPGYSVTVHGNIAADGTISGTDPWSWAFTKGTAKFTYIPDWGLQLSASACVGKIGAPVINITQKVINDADSGMAGNNWAIDNFNRHIQVWQIAKPDKTTGIGTYCALVTYEGKSQSIVGTTGPGGTGKIGDIVAEMKGGYRSTNFTASSSPSDWPAKGNVGTVDYKCDPMGNNCQPVSWVDKYFTQVNGFNDAWWGWFYYAGDHGSWLNSSDGSFGNIL